MRLKFRYLLFVIALLPLQLKGQALAVDTLTVMFYNVENYFDTINNPHANDEFTPDDVYEWTLERFVHKRNAIAQVIMAANANNPPDLIGLCEVENRGVLQQLLDSTALRDFGYSIVHHDSSDSRGIDVALLYKRERFRLLTASFSLMGSKELNGTKREILYAKGVASGGDTLHVFVNHFPSKRDGVAKTAPLRMAAAHALRTAVDSILILNSNANVLAMGDFNDTYNSKTVKNGLRARDNFTTVIDTALYCLSAQLAKQGIGSIKYQRRWQLVDMFFVSGSLLKPLPRFRCNPSNVQVVNMPFLMDYEPASNSYRPKPTYRWINYIGGYSDHLPTLLHIYRIINP